MNRSPVLSAVLLLALPVGSALAAAPSLPPAPPSGVTGTPQAGTETLLQSVQQWAESRERMILMQGQPLSPAQMADARAAGVAHPEKIRLLIVPEIPVPELASLRTAAAGAGMISPDNAGLTLGYGILLRSDCAGNRGLVGHEFTHVAQGERLGGLSGFLAEYVREVQAAGYDAAPLEQEAVLAERKFNRLSLTEKTPPR